MLVPRAQSQNLVEPVVLFDDFQQKQEVWLRLPLLLDNKTTCAVIHKYQVRIDNTIIHLNNISGSCYCFIYLCEFKIIPKDNLVVAIASTNSIFCLN